jgi:hexulose-6-phosphate isomerase
MFDKIAFMQGRLCDQVDEKIQAFPLRDWRKEFFEAQKLNLNHMEWTLDHWNIEQNPLMNDRGRAHILALMSKHSIKIETLTGDCFMQRPFHKEFGKTREALLSVLDKVIKSASALGIKKLVFPLVDNGSLKQSTSVETLKEHLLSRRSILRNSGIQILFESDLAAKQLKTFIDAFPKDVFGINYDTGNSASMGYDPNLEFNCYGHRIENVHIKDRKFGGNTVPLGAGNADFKLIFNLLKKAEYEGLLVLQTARANNGDHAGAISSYIQIVKGLIKNNGS